MNNSVYKTAEGREKIQAFCREVITGWPVDNERLEISANGYRTNVLI